jgi:hypothetical protein
MTNTIKDILRSGLLLVAAAVVLAGCKKPVAPPCEPCEPPGEYERVDVDPKVFIMYDNIGSWFIDDVEEAELGAASGILAKGHRVVVFQRGLSGGNEIYELVKDSSQRSGSRKKVLKKYGPGENDDLSVETIASVNGDIRALAPANHYGLAFGSHGSGWVPKGVDLQRSAGPDDIFAPLLEIRDDRLTRALAGYAQYIDVAEFADALDEWEWDFILFDDCFMASVEAMYEIRHLADYFIASPTEIMSRGFPYDRLIETLFTLWGDYSGMAREFVDYYQTVPKPGFNSLEPYATIAVIKTDELEKLASTVRAIDRSGLWTDVVDPSGIQYYEGLSTHVFFDLDDYLRRGLAPGGDEANLSSGEYLSFTAQLAKTVVFSDHTERFYSDFGQRVSHPINHFSGLSVFIPWSGTSTKFPAYRNTAWYKDVYGE